jgi:hypothetical protein
MPNPPIKPPNKDDLRTEITLNLHDKFKDEKDFKKKETLMIDYLINKLVEYKLHFKEYEKIMNELSEK